MRTVCLRVDIRVGVRGACVVLPITNGGWALIVEDEFLLAEVIGEVLRGAGCDDVRIATSLPHAQELLALSTPKLAILDVSLGTRDVFPVAEYLSAMRIPFVFCTCTPHTRMPVPWKRMPHVEKPNIIAPLLTKLVGLQSH